MIRSVRVELNSEGVGELLRSGPVVDVLMGKAERVLLTAKGTAPVTSGAYRDGLHIETISHGDRAVVRVSGGTDHDMNVEAHTGNLARALGSAR